MFAATKIFAVLTVSLLVGVANGKAPSRIVGGSRAGLHEFPYQISLQVNDVFHCGGAIISKRHILTAAHCVNDLTPDILKIATGTIFNTGGQMHDVSKIVPHPKYSATDVNDIAIITLANDISFNQNQRKIDLPTAPTPGGVSVIATGWGLRSAATQIVSPVLWKANLKTIDRDECEEMFGSDYEIYDNQICTFVRRGLGTCQGDSGGPLAYNGKLVGIVSWGIPCAVGLPDVFSSTYHHLNWIKQNMNTY